MAVVAAGRDCKGRCAWPLPIEGGDLVLLEFFWGGWACVGRAGRGSSPIVVAVHVCT